MARIQILELPMVHVGDCSETPFAVIIDQVPVDHEGKTIIDRTQRELLTEQLGARAVLVFEETIDIPANEVTIPGEDETASTVRVRLEPDFTGWDDALTTALARVHEAVAEQFTLKLGDKDVRPDAKAQHYIGAPEWCCHPAFRTLGKEHADNCTGKTVDDGSHGHATT